MLEGRDYSCFRDETHIHVGTALSPFIRNSIRRTKILVVVGTKEAPNSEWVRKEIAIFSKQSQRPFRKYRIIIPIDFTGISEKNPFPILNDTLWVISNPNGPTSATIDEISNSFKGLRKNQLGRYAISTIGALAIVAASILWIQKGKITRQRNQIQKEEQRVRSELLATRARAIGTRNAKKGLTLASKAHNLNASDLTWAAMFQVAASSRKSWLAEKWGQLYGDYQLERENSQIFWTSDRLSQSEEKIQKSKPTISVIDSNPKQDEFTFNAPQGGEITYTDSTTLILQVETSIKTNECKILVEGKVQHSFTTQNPPGFGVISSLEIHSPEKISAIQWWDLSRLCEESNLNNTLQARLVVTTPGHFEKATLGTEHTFWWIDSRHQLRQATANDHSHQVSDESFGKVLDFALSPDGAWVAVKHTDCIRVMDARSPSIAYDFQVEGAEKFKLVSDKGTIQIAAYCSGRKNKKHHVQLIEAPVHLDSPPKAKFINTRPWPTAKDDKDQYPLAVISGPKEEPSKK